MDFTSLNALLDSAIAYVQASSQKDKQIADLQSQNSTLTANLNADDAEIKTLTDKINQLSALLPQQPIPTTPQPSGS